MLPVYSHSAALHLPAITPSTQSSVTIMLFFAFLHPLLTPAALSPHQLLLLASVFQVLMCVFVSFFYAGPDLICTWSGLTGFIGKIGMTVKHKPQMSLWSINIFFDIITWTKCIKCLMMKQMRRWIDNANNCSLQFYSNVLRLSLREVWAQLNKQTLIFL